ncbi:hypothetical protein RYX36_033629 [Vicia faba]
MTEGMKLTDRRRSFAKNSGLLVRLSRCASSCWCFFSFLLGYFCFVYGYMNEWLFLVYEMQVQVKLYGPKMDLDSEAIEVNMKMDSLEGLEIDGVCRNLKIRSLETIGLG